MKFNFKKIVALGTSALMTLSGIGFAAAANYPTPFVSGGAANVAIVYGTGTGASYLDIVEAGNIAQNLQTFMTGTNGGSSSSVSGGEGVIIQKSSDKLNLGNLMSDLKSTLDYEDLPTLLAKGTYVAHDNDEFKYEQKITLGGANLTHFQDSDYEDQAGLSTKTPVVGFKISSSQFVLNYTIDFLTDAESAIVSSRADDIEGSKIPLFGKTYYVSELDTTGGASGFLGSLKLLDSAEIGSVSEGETTTVSGHEVGINFMDATHVSFIIDGGTPTSKLLEGDSVKITGTDSYIGVTDISKLVVSGTVGSATFSIGSGKVEIVSGNEIKLNDKTIDGVRGYVYNASGGTSTVAKLDKIVIEWKADEKTFLTPAEDVLVPGFGGLKFTMNNLVRSTEEVVKVEKDTDTAMALTLPLKDGSVTIPILYANTTGDFNGIGKSATERLATSGNSSLAFYEKYAGADYHKYFVATYNTSSQGESYVLRAKVSEDRTNGRNETTIEKYTPTGWTAVCEEKTTGQECNIGNVVLNVIDVKYTSGGNESAEFKAGTNVGFHTAITAGGLSVFLPYAVNISNTLLKASYGAINTTNFFGSGIGAIWNGTGTGYNYDSFYLYMDGEDKDDTISAGTQFYLTINDNGDEALEVTQLDGAGSANGGFEVGSDSSIYERYIQDDVAPRVLHYTKADEDWAEVYYPTGDSETYAEVYIAEQGSSITSTTTPSGTAALGEVLVKDSEVSSVSTKNLIVVGGSCINSAAANLVGGAYCGAAFTENAGVGSGQYLIKSYSGKYSTGKIALLVAGYEAADTVNAAKYLRTQTVDTSKSYIGTTDTTATEQTA